MVAVAARCGGGGGSPVVVAVAARCSGGVGVPVVLMKKKEESLFTD